MEFFSSSSSPVDGSLTLASAYFILVATEHFSLCNLTFSPFYSFIIDNCRLSIWFIYVPYQFLPLVVAMGTAEAAAAAPPTNGDPGSTCVAWRRRGCWWLRRPSPRVPYAVFPSLHLSHSARENPQSACTRHQQQATLHHWWVTQCSNAYRTFCVQIFIIFRLGLYNMSDLSNSWQGFSRWFHKLCAVIAGLLTRVSCVLLNVSLYWYVDKNHKWGACSVNSG